jgi:hypothetical protein
MTTETTVSPLRQRMIEDMNLRKLCAARRGRTSVAAGGLRHF